MCGLHPALSPFRRIVVLPFWNRPSCLSQVDSFMLTVAFAPFGHEATQAQRWLKCQPSSYVRLEAYGFFGLSEGA